MLKSLLNNVSRVQLRLWDELLALMVSSQRNIEARGRLVVRGKPAIDIRGDAKLVIGNNVTLNSRNVGHHVNLYSPVKLLADRKGAEIHIGENSRIHGTCIHACQFVSIGKNCLIAANCQIMDSSGHDLSFSNVENRINTRGGSRPVVIEDSVWIGTHSIILPGVRVGYGSVIAAGSVVTKDIPPMAIAGGNPAVLIRDYGSRASQSQVSEPIIMHKRERGQAAPCLVQHETKHLAPRVGERT